MVNRPRVICLGEALIDFVSAKSGVSLGDADQFIRAPGGAPANVAVGLSRLGVPTAFIGKVGDDPFGRFLKKTLKENGVDVSNLLFDKTHKTRLAFVSLTPDAGRDFEFFGDPAADSQLREEEINSGLFEKLKLFHFGSISLISEPSRGATFSAVSKTQQSGGMVSFDPNLRLALWNDGTQAQAWIIKGIRCADVVKVSGDELDFIAGGEDLNEGCQEILGYGAKLVIVSLGAEGCYFQTPKCRGSVEGFPVNAVDTTGAGDGFVAGLLAMIAHADQPIEEMSKKCLWNICRFANAVGALTTTKPGAIPALPAKDEVTEFLTGKIE
ncbi:hypothetical protein ISS37_06190 [candidate division KSB1 bacterium]|nr:hypothetical protein [candidate division KSB1 bacterium]